MNIMTSYYKVRSVFHSLTSVCALGLALVLLNACQTTGTAPETVAVDPAVQSEKDAIDRALARANGANNSEASGSLYVVERAYKRNPEDLNATINYARALRQEGLGHRALLILKPQLSASPNNPEVLTEFAAGHLSLGQYQEAENAARKAVVEDPEMYRAYHVLGVALDAQGFHDQAEVAFRRGLDHWQGDPVPILNNLALSLAAQGYLDESLSILRRAAASAPNRSEIERNLRIISALHKNMQGRASQAATSIPQAGGPAFTPPLPRQKPQ